jgi:hypothetical protein
MQDQVTPQEGFLQTLKGEMERPDLSLEEIDALALRYGVTLPDGFAKQALRNTKTTVGQKAIRSGQKMGSEAMRIVADGLEMAAGMGEDALKKFDDWKLLDPEGKQGEFGALFAGRFAKSINEHVKAFEFLGEKFRDLEEGAIASPELEGRGGKFGEHVAPALASGLMFMGGGMGGAALKLPYWATSAPIGALMNAAPAYLDAEAAGASPEDKWLAAVANGAFGAVTETAGLSGPLKKLAGVLAKADTRSGGALSKGFVGQALGFAGEAVRSGVKEAATESAQQAFSDIVHENLTDEDREVFANIFAENGAAETGFWAGLIFGGLAGPQQTDKLEGRIRKGRIKDAEKKQAAERKTEIEERLIELHDEGENLAQGTPEAAKVEAEIEALEDELFKDVPGYKEEAAKVAAEEEARQPKGEEQVDQVAAERERREALEVPSVTDLVESGELESTRKGPSTIDAKGEVINVTEEVAKGTIAAGEGTSAPETSSSESPSSAPSSEAPVAPTLEAAKKVGKRAEADYLIRESTGTEAGQVLNADQVATAAKALAKAGVNHRTARQKLSQKANIISARAYEDIERRIRKWELLERTADGESYEELQENRAKYRRALADLNKKLSESVSEEVFNRAWGEVTSAATGRVETEAAKFPEYGEKTAQEAVRKVGAPSEAFPDLPGDSGKGTQKALATRQMTRAKIRQKAGMGFGDPMGPQHLTRTAKAAQELGLSKEEWSEALSDDLRNIKAARRTLDDILPGTKRSLEREQEHLRKGKEVLAERQARLKDLGPNANPRDIWEAQEEIEDAQRYVKQNEEQVERTQDSLKANKAFRVSDIDSVWDAAGALMFSNRKGLNHSQIKKTALLAKRSGIKKEKWKDRAHDAAGNILHFDLSDDAYLDRVWESAKLIEAAESSIEGIVEMHAGVPGVTELRKLAQASKEYVNKITDAPIFEVSETADASDLVKAAKRTWYQKWVDTLSAVEKTQDLLYAGAVPDMNVVALERGRKGRQGYQIDEANRNYAKPIVRLLHKNNIDLATADKYVMAKHAPERNAALVKRQPAFQKLNEKLREAIADGDTDLENDIRMELNLLWGDVKSGTSNQKWDLEKNAPSGMADSEAKRIVAELEGKHPALRDLSKQFNKLNKATLDLLRDSGLIKSELHDTLRKIYPNYVPLRTMIEGEQKYLGLDGEPIRKAKGRKSLADSPLAFGLSQMNEAIIKAERNKVFQGLLNQVNDGHWDDVAKVYTPKELAKLRRQKRLSKVKMDPELSFKVRVGGELSVVVFKDEFGNIARALHGLNEVQLGRASEVSAGISRFLSQAVTRYSPEFLLPNGVRDAFTATAHAFADGDTKAAWKTFSGGFRGAYAYLRGEASGEWGDWVERYKKSGAPITFMDLKSAKREAESLQKALTSKSDLAHYAKAPLDAIAHLSDSIENAFRLSYFRFLVEHGGLTDAQAAAKAKDLTTNFERHGDFGKMMNAWFMFSNAGIQGVDRVARAVKDNPVKMGQAMASGLAIHSLLGVGIRALMGEDDDGEDRYDKIADYEKDTHWIIPYGAMTGGDPMARIKIPMPRVYSFINALAQHGTSAIMGEETLSEAHGKTWGAALQEFFPFDLNQRAGFVPLPTVAQLPVQVISNRDWKGDPIRPQKWNERKPDSENYWPGVSGWARRSAAKLNALSGGDKYEEGFISMSPETMVHVLRGVTGGLGATVERGVNLATDDDIERHEIPIVRRFVAKSSPFRTLASFNEAHTELEREHDRRKGERPGRRIRPSRELSRARKAKEEAAELRRKADASDSPETRKRLLEKADRHLQRFMLRYNRSR